MMVGWRRLSITAKPKVYLDPNYSSRFSRLRQGQKVAAWLLDFR